MRKTPMMQQLDLFSQEASKPKKDLGGKPSHLSSWEDLQWEWAWDEMPESPFVLLRKLVDGDEEFRISRDRVEAKCPSCGAEASVSKEEVERRFSSLLKRGKITAKNYEAERKNPVFRA